MTRLLFLPDGPDEAPEIVEAGAHGPVRRKLLPSEQAGGSAMLVLPGARAVSRWLDLPGGSLAQARAAAAFQVGDAVATGAEGLHLAVGERDAEGRALVVWIDREVLRSALETARARGVEVTGAAPDYLFLPDDAEGRTVLAAFGERLGVRAEGLAFGVEPELASIVVGDRPHRYIPASELDAWLLASATRPAVDLLQGQFAPRTQGPVLRWKRLAVLAAVVVVSPLVLLLAQVAKDGLAARALEARNRTLAVRLVPQAARYGDPARFAVGRLQARTRLGFGDLAAGYVDAVRSVSGMRLDTLVHGQDGAIRSSVSYVNYSDMDQLRRALKSGGFDVVEQGTLTEGQRVTSDLIIRRRP
ncbi:type II secretion system protein GspL [Caulobacter endophyticus]|uniref:type II secretion system protein GspL n=1 Tax=Caulobacter endophyticus TaxID=2172652 RepID=UPI002410816A|nr:type II secretion system protein GspL [Caulobacter endophyticus]MDG2531395.1 type II secretion system protein GspL [Caulobacter endophyticus]